MWASSGPDTDLLSGVLRIEPLECTRELATPEQIRGCLLHRSHRQLVAAPGRAACGGTAVTGWHEAISTLVASPVGRKPHCVTRQAPHPIDVTGGAHSFEEHTGELRLRLEAASLDGLFVEAGTALAEILGRAAETGETLARELVVDARDRETLLTSWLNALVALTEQHGMIFNDLTVDHLTDVSLRATARGREVAETRTQVKAATLHGLKIERTRSGYSASIVLDV